MTPDEVRKLTPGTILTFNPKMGIIGNYAAKKGARARFVFQGTETYNSLTGGMDRLPNPNSSFIIVSWVRDHLSGTQNDGGYYFTDFEVLGGSATVNVPIAIKSSTAKSCDCSSDDFRKYGCRFMKKPDLSGLLHN